MSISQQSQYVNGSKREAIKFVAQSSSSSEYIGITENFSSLENEMRVVNFNPRSTLFQNQLENKSREEEFNDNFLGSKSGGTQLRYWSPLRREYVYDDVDDEEGKNNLSFY